MLGYYIELALYPRKMKPKARSFGAFLLGPKTNISKPVKRKNCHGKTPQNVQALLLMERFPLCRETSNPILEKPNPS